MTEPTTEQDRKAAEEVTQKIAESLNEYRDVNIWRELAPIIARHMQAEREARERLIALLSKCRSDIYQTARTNQCNLTGHDIVTPDDPPITSRIGNCQVHQQGVDESLALCNEIESTLNDLQALKGTSDGT